MKRVGGSASPEEHEEQVAEATNSTTLVSPSQRERDRASPALHYQVPSPCAKRDAADPRFPSMGSRSALLLSSIPGYSLSTSPPVCRKHPKHLCSSPREFGLAENKSALRCRLFLTASRCKTNPSLTDVRTTQSPGRWKKHHTHH